MGYRMDCGADPREVGIEKENGSLDYDKFKEHIKGCDKCYDFVESVLRYMMDIMRSRYKQRR